MNSDDDEDYARYILERTALWAPNAGARRSARRTLKYLDDN